MPAVKSELSLKDAENNKTEEAKSARSKSSSIHQPDNMDEMQFDNDYVNQPNNVKSKSLTRLRPYSNQFTKQASTTINKSIEFGNEQGIPDGISSIGGMMQYDENEPYSAYGMSDKNAYRKKVRFPGENKGRQSV